MTDYLTTRVLIDSTDVWVNVQTGARSSVGFRVSVEEARKLHALLGDTLAAISPEFWTPKVGDRVRHVLLEEEGVLLEIITTDTQFHGFQRLPAYIVGLDSGGTRYWNSLRPAKPITEADRLRAALQEIADCIGDQEPQLSDYVIDTGGHVRNDVERFARDTTRYHARREVAEIARYYLAKEEK